MRRSQQTAITYVSFPRTPKARIPRQEANPISDAVSRDRSMRAFALVDRNSAATSRRILSPRMPVADRANAVVGSAASRYSVNQKRKVMRFTSNRSRYSLCPRHQRRAHKSRRRSESQRRTAGKKWQSTHFLCTPRLRSVNGTVAASVSSNDARFRQHFLSDCPYLFGYERRPMTAWLFRLPRARDACRARSARKLLRRPRHAAQVAAQGGIEKCQPCEKAPAVRRHANGL
jgi:hypothetical protein